MIFANRSPEHVWRIKPYIRITSVLVAIFLLLRKQPYLHKISNLFILSNILNVSWLLFWHYDQIALSVVLMFALLSTLITIYLRLNIGKATVSLKEKACVHLPFSVYLCWITVASIANVAAALVSVQWDGFGLASDLWSVLVIAVALITALAVIATRRDVAYGLVLIWALVGIAVKQSAYQNVAVAAEASAVIIAVALVAVTIAYRLKK